MSAHSARLLTAAIETRLTAVGVGLLVGVGIKPAGGGWAGAEGASTFTPYTVIFPTPGGYSDGSLCVPFGDVAPDYTISSFGATVAQAQGGDDRVRAALASPGTVVVSGRLVLLAIPDVDGGVLRDDDVQPVIFHAPTRWRFMTTSAA